MKTGCGKACALIIWAMILGSASMAASDPKDKEKHYPAAKAADPDVAVGVEIFVGKDREVIRQYFHGQALNLPPGLAKRGSRLPPGLEKQLRRKGHLPPGLEKRVAVFPAELERKLPPLKPGLIRGTIEGRAVIMNVETSVILDIFTF